MGFLHVLAPVGAATIFFLTGHWVLGTMSTVVAIASFWTYGVMHNHAVDAARQMGVENPRFFLDNLSAEQQREALDAVPNHLTLTSALLSLGGVGLLIAAIVLAIW